MHTDAISNHLSDEVDCFAAVLAGAVTEPKLWNRPVRACPEWDLRKLTEHLGAVHRRTSGSLRYGKAGRVPTAEFPRPGIELRDWFIEGGRDLLDALDQPPENETWTFDPTNRTVGFWLRRQTHETLIHRCDAEAAVDQVIDIPADLAADGVAEVLNVMVRLRVAEGHVKLPADPVTFRATDTGDSWTLDGSTPGGDPVATVDGTAAELYLALWKRLPTDTLQITGDEGTANALLASSLTP